MNTYYRTFSDNPSFFVSTTWPRTYPTHARQLPTFCFWKFAQFCDASLSFSSKKTRIVGLRMRGVIFLQDSFYFEGSKTKNFLFKVFKVATWGILIRYTKGIPLIIALAAKIAHRSLFSMTQNLPLLQNANFKMIPISEQDKERIITNLTPWIESHLRHITVESFLPSANEISGKSIDERFYFTIDYLISRFSHNAYYDKSPQALPCMTMPRDNLLLAFVVQYILVESWTKVISSKTDFHHAWETQHAISNDSYNALQEALKRSGKELADGVKEKRELDRYKVYPKLALHRWGDVFSVHVSKI